MIYLQLFLCFLKIGAFTFGGGYAMIPLIQEECLRNNWLTQEEIINFIAVAESTPGPIAVNMATFVGSSQAGFLGALLATLGVVMPAFIIILLIAMVFNKLIKHPAVKSVFNGVRPVISALIISTAIIFFLNIVLNFKTISSAPIFDYKSFLILLAISGITFTYKKLINKKISPILLIFISGIFGIILF